MNVAGYTGRFDGKRSLLSWFLGRVHHLRRDVATSYKFKMLSDYPDRQGSNIFSRWDKKVSRHTVGSCDGKQLANSRTDSEQSARSKERARDFALLDHGLRKQINEKKGSVKRQRIQW